MKIIGIGGTNGSGKDTLANMLADDYGWLFVSGSDILRKELTKRHLPIERENLRELSAEWRRQHSLGYLIDKAVEIFMPQKNRYTGLAISSLRNFGEAERVHELGGQIIWVDATPKLRYERIYSRRRSAEDKKSFEQFLAEEKAEMSHSGDEATLNMAAVRDMADIFITNDDNDIEKFKETAQKALKL